MTLRRTWVVVPMFTVALSCLAIAQGRTQAVPSAVADLLSKVKDIASLEAARKTNPTQLLFALADMHGGLAAAAKKVAEQGQERAAVTEIIKVLNTCNNTPDAGTLCARAAYALPDLGPAAKSAGPALEILLKHKDGFASNAAKEVLEKIGK